MRDHALVEPERPGAVRRRPGARRRGVRSRRRPPGRPGPRGPPGRRTRRRRSCPCHPSSPGSSVPPWRTTPPAPSRTRTRRARRSSPGRRRRRRRRRRRTGHAGRSSVTRSSARSAHGGVDPRAQGGGRRLPWGQRGPRSRVDGGRASEAARPNPPPSGPVAPRAERRRPRPAASAVGPVDDDLAGPGGPLAVGDPGDGRPRDDVDDLHGRIAHHEAPHRSRGHAPPSGHVGGGARRAARSAPTSPMARWRARPQATARSAPGAAPVGGRRRTST